MACAMIETLKVAVWCVFHLLVGFGDYGVHVPYDCFAVLLQRKQLSMNFRPSGRCVMQ